jgi:hypothetical protein
MEREDKMAKKTKAEIQQKVKDLILKEEQNGNIVVFTIEGLVSAPLDKIIEQPADGILYDLNRDKVTIMTFINDKKWVNDYACALVIAKLKKELEHTEKQYNELRKHHNERCVDGDIW